MATFLPLDRLTRTDRHTRAERLQAHTRERNHIVEKGDRCTRTDRLRAHTRERERNSVIEKFVFRTLLPLQNMSDTSKRRTMSESSVRARTLSSSSSGGRRSNKEALNSNPGTDGMSVSGHDMSVSGHGISVFGHNMPVLGHGMSVLGHGMSAPGHGMSVSGHGILLHGTTCQSQGTACQSRDMVCQSLDMVHQSQSMVCQSQGTACFLFVRFEYMYVSQPVYTYPTDNFLSLLLLKCRYKYGHKTSQFMLLQIA